MANPIIVQGTAVVVPPQNGGDASFGGVAEATHTNEESPSKTGCNDPIFALLFYVNIVAIGAVFVIYGRKALSGDQGHNYAEYIYVAIAIGVISLLASGLGLFMLMACPAFMIKAGLIFSIVVSLLWTVYAFSSLSMIYGVLGVVFFVFTVCYVKMVWGRIPFAAINMMTAGTAIKANLGVALVAIFFTLLEVGWLVLWGIAFTGTFTKTQSCDNDECSPNYGILFLLFLSLFFTQQVLQSCVHVSVAGTVGTWWVAPNESGCCSRAVCNSFIRTITTSFGSICFGSLLVAILQALRTLAATARQSDDCALFACIAECILSFLASLLEYFNKWAFIYVGVYGFGYIESGKSVMQLFANRGWEAIIADDLVGGAILLTCVIIGLIIGAICVGFAGINADFLDLFQGSKVIAFFIGMIPSVLICSILLSTIASGVNTVIVMFADAPQEFEQNHPELSGKMREAWQQFYPGSVQ